MPLQLGLGYQLDFTVALSSNPRPRNLSLAYDYHVLSHTYKSLLNIQDSWWVLPVSEKILIFLNLGKVSCNHRIRANTNSIS